MNKQRIAHGDITKARWYPAWKRATEAMHRNLEDDPDALICVANGEVVAHGDEWLAAHDEPIPHNHKLPPGWDLEFAVKPPTAEEIEAGKKQLAECLRLEPYGTYG